MPRVFKTLTNGAVIEKFSGSRNKSPESVANGDHEQTTYLPEAPIVNENGETTTTYNFSSTGSGTMAAKATAVANGTATRFSVPTGVGITNVSVEVDDFIPLNDDTTPFTILRGSSPEGLDEVVISPAPQAGHKVNITYSVDKTDWKIVTYEVTLSWSNFTTIDRNSSVIEPPKLFVDGIEKTFTMELGTGIGGGDKMSFDQLALTGQRVTIMYRNPPPEIDVWNKDFWKRDQSGFTWVNGATWQHGIYWRMVDNGPQVGDHIYTRDPNALLLAAEKSLDVSIVVFNLGVDETIYVYGETELGVQTPTVTITTASPSTALDVNNDMFTFNLDFSGTGDVATAGAPRKIFFSTTNTGALPDSSISITNIAIDDSASVALTGTVDESDSSPSLPDFDLASFTALPLDTFSSDFTISDLGPERQVFRTDTPLAANTTYTIGIGDSEGEYDTELYVYNSSGGASIAHNDDYSGVLSQVTFTTGASSEHYYFGIMSYDDELDGGSSGLAAYIHEGTSDIPPLGGGGGGPVNRIDLTAWTPYSQFTPFSIVNAAEGEELIQYHEIVADFAPELRSATHPSDVPNTIGVDGVYIVFGYPTGAGADAEVNIEVHSNSGYQAQDHADPTQTPVFTEGGYDYYELEIQKGFGSLDGINEIIFRRDITPANVSHRPFRIYHVEPY